MSTKTEPKELLVDETKIGDRLTLKQELFCRLYAQNSELFGNGVLSYSEAYGYHLNKLDQTPELDNENRPIPKSSEYDRAYNVCGVGAYDLLKNPKINDRITELLNELMTDIEADGELAYVLKQRRDLSNKVSAIKEYNKLKQRIVDKSEVKNTVMLGHLSDEQKAGLSLLLEPEKPVEEVAETVVAVQPNEEQAVSGQE